MSDTVKDVSIHFLEALCNIFRYFIIFDQHALVKKDEISEDAKTRSKIPSSSLTESLTCR